MQAIGLEDMQVSSVAPDLKPLSNNDDDVMIFDN